MGHTMIFVNFTIFKMFNIQYSMNMYSIFKIFNIQVLGKKKNHILLKHLYSLTRSENLYKMAEKNI